MIPRTVPIVCARSKQPRGQSIAVRIFGGDYWHDERGRIKYAPPEGCFACACCGQRVKVTW